MAMGKPTISVCEQKTLEVLRFTCPTRNLLQNKETRKGGWHQCYTTDKNILLWLLCVKVTTKHLSFLTKGGCEGQKWHLVRITEVSQKSLCKSVQVAQPWSEDLTLSSMRNLDMHYSASAENWAESCLSTERLHCSLDQSNEITKLLAAPASNSQHTCGDEMTAFISIMTPPEQWLEIRKLSGKRKKKKETSKKCH